MAQENPITLPESPRFRMRNAIMKDAQDAEQHDIKNGRAVWLAIDNLIGKYGGGPYRKNLYTHPAPTNHDSGVKIVLSRDFGVKQNGDGADLVLKTRDLLICAEVDGAPMDALVRVTEEGDMVWDPKGYWYRKPNPVFPDDINDIIEKLRHLREVLVTRPQEVDIVALV
jgi:hypothetical protein